jgi:hypothetical protein
MVLQVKMPNVMSNRGETAGDEVRPCGHIMGIEKLLQKRFVAGL